MSMESDDVEACSSTSEISEDFNVPGTSQSWRSQSLSLPRYSSDLVDGLRKVETHGWIPSKYKERLLRLDTQAQKIRRRRKPVRILHKLKQDNNDPTFPQRTITTIDEEKVVLWHSCERRPSSREVRIHTNSMTNEFGTSKLKFCKESDDMKRIVNRLKKVAETNPEMLKDSMPDETIKLFKSIQIKRNPVRIVPKPQHPFPSTSTSGHQSVDNDPTFPKRKLTTIPEGEVFYRNVHISKRQMRICNNEPFPNRPQTSKSKAYNEKVAAFKAMLNRITEMADKKSEMLQDTLPDETIKLFKSIHIK